MARGITMDLTTGRPMKQLLLFSAPLVVGTLFQQLYGFVDTVMVGRFISNDALGAVGITWPLNYLVLGFVQGTSVGFGIPLAQSVGAKEPEQFKRYFWNGTWLCLAIAAVMTTAMYLLAGPLLRLIQTPDELFLDAKQYIQIIYLGIPASILYNFSAGALRAVGDSQRPTYFLMFSGILNLVLDYVFIVTIPMGVLGAALATVLSQLVSGLLNMGWLALRTGCLAGSRGLRRPSVAHLLRLSKVGFPMGFDHTVTAIGSLVMQSAINSLGTAVVTGQAAGEKIRAIFTTPMESVGMGMATYAGQNDGANRPDRIKSGIKAGLTLHFLYCVAAWVVMFFGKGAFTALVLGPNSGEAGALCVEFLSVMSTLFLIHGSLMIFRNTLQGMGYSVHAVFSGVFELIGRSLGAFLAVKVLGFFGICISAPLAWSFALIYCACTTTVILRKRLKAYKQEKSTMA